MKTPADALLPCPFCGSDELFDSSDYTDAGLSIQCLGCNARTNDATEWNRRAAAALPVKPVAAIDDSACEWDDVSEAWVRKVSQDEHDTIMAAWNSRPRHVWFAADITPEFNQRVVVETGCGLYAATYANTVFFDVETQTEYRDVVGWMPVDTPARAAPAAPQETVAPPSPQGADDLITALRQIEAKDTTANGEYGYFACIARSALAKVAA